MYYIASRPDTMRFTEGLCVTGVESLIAFSELQGIVAPSSFTGATGARRLNANPVPTIYGHPPSLLQFPFQISLPYKIVYETCNLFIHSFLIRRLLEDAIPIQEKMATSSEFHLMSSPLLSEKPSQKLICTM